MSDSAPALAARPATRTNPLAHTVTHTATRASSPPPYCGRFAPSPTGPLHLGSLVSALASYLDARAHRGRWLVRIEDVDGPRSPPGVAEQILLALQRLGMHCDEAPLWQSRRIAAYEQALAQLTQAGMIYPCACSRREIADSLAFRQQRLDHPLRHATLTYPGTCRAGLHGKPARAWRVRVPEDVERAQVRFEDRWHGPVEQNLATEVGDFVLKRADGQWAYQLAVVVDDAASQVTHIVRGADLLESTGRQIYLQRLLGLPTPAYLHVPVVENAAGEKLSKQTGAQALDLDRPMQMLHLAARHLGLPHSVCADSIESFYAAATQAWAARHGATELRHETPGARPKT